MICVGWEDLSTFFFWEIPPVFLSSGESVFATNKQVLSRKNCAILICSRGQKWICQRDKLGFPNATCLSFPLTQNKYFLPVWFTRIICSKFYLTSVGMVLSATTLLRFSKIFLTLVSKIFLFIFVILYRPTLLTIRFDIDALTILTGNWIPFLSCVSIYPQYWTAAYAGVLSSLSQGNEMNRMNVVCCFQLYIYISLTLQYRLWSMSHLQQMISWP